MYVLVILKDGIFFYLYCDILFFLMIGNVFHMQFIYEKTSLPEKNPSRYT